MNDSVEDRINAATRAAGNTVREVRPLSLPDLEALPGLRASRRRTWLMPVAAAAAVIALGISLVIVRSISGPPPTGAVSGAHDVPRYYVALSKMTMKLGKRGLLDSTVLPTSLLVRDSITGATLANVPPPKGTSFIGVTASADDRTFVVDTKPYTGDPLTAPRTWYLLTIAPGSRHPVRLARLPMPSLSGIGGIALSGSGRKLAVALLASQHSGMSMLRIYSVATGRLLNAWSTRDTSVFGVGDAMFGESNRALTWVDGDRSIAFPAMWLTRKHNRSQNIQYMTMRLLDASRSDGDLIADSRVVWTSATSVLRSHPSGCVWGASPLISADGKTIVCPSVQGPNGGPESKIVSWRVAWLAYSTSSPDEAHALYQTTVRASAASLPIINGLWINTSGTAVLGGWSVARFSEPVRGMRFGISSRDGFQTLPMPPEANVSYPPGIRW